MCPRNYRPVSILGPLSRLVEKIVCIQVIDYLETNNLLHPSIHGYRKAHSCSTAVIDMYEEAIMAQEEGQFFGLNMYDQSSALDLVDFEIFWAKLGLLGFEEETISWYRNFLTNRKIYVSVEGQDSETEPMVCGAP